MGLTGDHGRRYAGWLVGASGCGGLCLPVQRVVAESAAEAALQRGPAAGGRFRPGRRDAIVDAVHEDPGHEAGIWRRRRRVRFVEFDAFALVAQPALEWAQNCGVSVHAKPGLEGCQGTGVSHRIKTHHQQITLRRHDHPRRETKAKAAPQLPRVSREIGIKQRNAIRREIIQFNELFVWILDQIGAYYRYRMIHQFVDHHGPDLWIRVCQTGARAKLGQRRWAVLAKGALTQRYELHTRAVGITTQRNPVLRRTKLHARAVASEIAARVRHRKIHRVAMSRIQGKAGEYTGIGIELVLVKHREATSRDDRVVGDAELLQFPLAVAQIPAANTQRGGRQVGQLDRIFQRRVGVGQNFVDHGAG